MSTFQRDNVLRNRALVARLAERGEIVWKQPEITETEARCLIARSSDSTSPDVDRWVKFRPLGTVPVVQPGDVVLVRDPESRPPKGCGDPPGCYLYAVSVPRWRGYVQQMRDEVLNPH